MLTPNDVAQHRFNTVRFNGYKTSDVDEFLDELTADYTALYKENAVLKSKIKVLVDKISEYRAGEEDIRLTLITARKTADAIVAEANVKKQELLSAAEEEVAEYRTQIYQDIEDSQAQLLAARRSTLDFAAGMRALMNRQQAFIERELDFLDKLDEIKAEPKTQEETEASEVQQPEVHQPEEAGLDEQLMADMAAAEAAAVASPESAYEQDVLSELSELMDEPTRIVDMSDADDKDYQF